MADLAGGYIGGLTLGGAGRLAGLAAGEITMPPLYGGRRLNGFPSYLIDMRIGAADTTPPTIENFDPVVGTPLRRSDEIAFDVIDNLSALRRVIVLVTLADETFCVHDGFTFKGEFVGRSSRSSIPGGYHYRLRRNSGWTDAPTFEVCAIDTSGNEAT